MRYLVIQERGRKDHYVDVARCADAADAILLAAALAKAKPMQGCVQVYRLHKGTYAYNLLCVTPLGTAGNVDADVQKALETHRAQEKKWRQEQHSKKRRVDAIHAFRQRFSAVDFAVLHKDATFSKALFAEPIQAAAADARAAELGIFAHTEAGKAVAA